MHFSACMQEEQKMYKTDQRGTEQEQQQRQMLFVNNSDAKPIELTSDVEDRVVAILQPYSAWVSMRDIRCESESRHELWYSDEKFPQSIFKSGFDSPCHENNFACNSCAFYLPSTG
jgi:aromatic ring-opening dioxygenase catalytic subunit (LigB family)